VPHAHDKEFNPDVEGKRSGYVDPNLSNRLAKIFLLLQNAEQIQVQVGRLSKKSSFVLQGDSE
jgi:hypothetical protein